MKQIAIERPVDNRRYYAALAVSAFIVCLAVAAIRTHAISWALVVLLAYHFRGLLLLWFRRPNAMVVVGADMIRWQGDGIVFPRGKVVSFVELESIELRSDPTGDVLLLNSRYSKPRVINSNYFTDGRSVLRAIHELRPNFSLRIDGLSYSST